MHEWQLAQMAFGDFMAIHPNCLKDWRFLVNLYIFILPLTFVDTILSTNATRWNIIFWLTCLGQIIHHHIICWNSRFKARGSHIQIVFIPTASKQAVCTFKGSLSLPPESERFGHSIGLNPYRQKASGLHIQMIFISTANGFTSTMMKLSSMVPLNWQLPQMDVSRRIELRIAYGPYYTIWSMWTKARALTLSHMLGTIYIYCATSFHIYVESDKMYMRMFAAPMLSSTLYSNDANEL